MGFKENGGPFSLFQLKVIQEVITLLVFTVFNYFFQNRIFKMESSGCIFLFNFSGLFCFQKIKFKENLGLILLFIKN
jgi:uncharacterized protein (DUF486 family)